MQTKLALQPAVEAVAEPAITPAVELSDEQTEIVGQINDLAYEHPDKTFAELVYPIAAKFENEPSFV
jgi:hypothetical protein